jgi:hypothetical protein
LDEREPRLARSPARRGRWVLAGLLLVLTAVTTCAFGARMRFAFDHNLPSFDMERDWDALIAIWRDPRVLSDGLPYSITLLLILGAHELGHYLSCCYHSIAASPPYFLPSPFFIGTFGAFIRFRSAVPDRKSLFDVGVAGPLAGFLLIVPALGVGLALSRVVPGLGGQSELTFGTPLLMRWIEMWLFPGVSPEDISLHPVARAAWVGLLATALNLLPVGQLDGGHLVYSAFGEKHKLVSLAVIAALVPLGFVYWPWWAWAAVLFVLGRKHFMVAGDGELDAPRKWVLALALLIFVLSFIPAPVLYNDGGSGRL